MLTSRYLSKLFLAFVGVILLTAVVVSVLESRRIDQAARRFTEHSLEEQSSLLVELARAPLKSGGFDQAFQQQIEGVGKGSTTRLTVIAPDGVVLADSNEHPQRMKNHGDRPEVVAVHEGRDPAVFERYSATVGQELVYLARGVRENGVLLGIARTSCPLAFVGAEAARSRRAMAFGALLVVLMACAVAYLAARHLTDPLREMRRSVALMAGGDAARRVQVRGRDEVAELAIAYNALMDQLQQRMAALAKDRSDVVATLRSMVEGVVATDAAQRIVILNDSARRMLRMGADDYVGVPLWKVTGVQRLTEIVDRTIDERRETEEEVVVTRRSGDAVIQFRSTPTFEERDPAQIAGVVVVAHDVTELRRLERVRRDLVSNVSHELKTPLTVMRGVVETLLDDDGDDMPPAMRMRFLHKIQDHIGRLTALVQDQLTLARLESSDVDPDWELVDLGAITSDALSMSESLIAEKHITLDASGITSEDATMRGDPEALRQLVRNLVENAVKYTPAEGLVRVSLRIDRAALMLEVEDSGCGLSDADSRRVFERFYRVDHGRSPELGGTGLGLSIVRNVAAAHGGLVGVESELGRGSRFYARLPRDAARQSVDELRARDSVRPADFTSSSPSSLEL